MTGGSGDASASAPDSSRAVKLLGRVDVLLTPDRLALYPIALVVAWGIAYFVVAFGSGHWEPLPDFASRWTAGRMLLDGGQADLYDPSVQSALQGQQLGASALSWFVSPPFVALLFAPLAALPYGVACAIWAAMLVLGLVVTAHLLRPLAPPSLARRWGAVLLIVGASAPVLEALGSGQDTVIVLVVLVGGIRLLLKGRDSLGGVVLALGLIKPHLVFLVPVVLLIQGRLRALAAFLVAAMGLAILSWWIVGGDGIQTWLTLPFTDLYASEVTAGQTWKSTSIAAFLTSLAPASAASWWPAIATAIGLALVMPALLVMVARRHTLTTPTMWSLALLTTAVASPHFMLYDVILCLPVVLTLTTYLWDELTRVLLVATFVLLWLVAPLHLLAARLAWPFALVATPWAALGILVLWGTFSYRAGHRALGSHS